MPRKKVKIIASTRGRGGKKNRSRPSSTTVAVVVPRSSRKKRVRAKSGMRARAGFAPTVLALRDPFARGALGCKWPSPVSPDTITFHCKGTSLLTSSGIGTLTGVFLPDPLVSYIANSGGFNGFPSAYTANPTWLSAVNPLAFQGQLSAYRVVSAGVRFRNLQAPLSATGRLLISPIAFPGRVPSPTILQNYGFSSTNAARTVFGAASGTLDTMLVMSNLIDLQGAKLYTVAELLGECQISAVCKPTGPAVTSWKLPAISGSDDASIGGTTWEGLPYATGAPSGTVGFVDPYWGDFNDFNGLAIVGSGFPSGTAILEMDWIYHIEGMRQVASSTSSGFSTSSLTIPVVGDVGDYLSAATSNPDSWLEDMRSTANSVTRRAAAVVGIGRDLYSAYRTIKGGFGSLSLDDG